MLEEHWETETLVEFARKTVTCQVRNRKTSESELTDEVSRNWQMTSKLENRSFFQDKFRG